MTRDIYFKRDLRYFDKNNERISISQDDILDREEPVVILGEPGMGKTELTMALGKAEQAVRVTARRFINSRNPQRLIGNSRIVIIDALDEVATNSDGAAVDLVLQQLEELGDPQFVLSCRAFDWQSATSSSAIGDQYGQDPLLLHLEPLTRDEQIRYLSSHTDQTRAQSVVEHFGKHGLDFLGNPMTVQMVAELDLSSPLPENRNDLYERAASRMCVERNNAKAALELPRQRVLDAAGAVFATLILSGKSAISRKAGGNADEQDLPLSEMKAILESGAERAFDTRLFSSGEDRFSYWHRQIGEFLGAKWLVGQATSARKRKRLLRLFRVEGQVPASIRGLHAWLAQDAALAPAVIAADPIGVIEYGDADSLSAPSASLLLKELQCLAQENPRFRDWRPLNARSLMSGACQSASIDALLDPNLPDSLRVLLIEQVGDTLIADANNLVLTTLLLDTKVNYSIRTKSGDALRFAGGICWAVLIEKLLSQRTITAAILAFEAMVEMDPGLLTEAQIVRVILAYDGLPLKVDGHQVETRSRSFWRLNEWSSAQRAEALLDEFCAQTRPLLSKLPDIDENGLIDFFLKLVLQRIAAGTVDPLKLLSWLELFKDAVHYKRDAGREIAAWLNENEVVRRQIQAHFFFPDQGKKPGMILYSLSQISGGLYPDEGDIVVLLDAMELDDRRWRDLLLCVVHDEDRGLRARQISRRFAGSNMEALRWIDGLPTPRFGRKEKRRRRQKNRRAGRKALSQQRFLIDMNDKVKDVQSVPRALLLRFSMIYLGRFSDSRNDLEPHLRLAECVGERVAGVALEAMERFLNSDEEALKPENVAGKIAENNQFSMGDVVIAAVAERVRKIDPVVIGGAILGHGSDGVVLSRAA